MKKISALTAFRRTSTEKQGRDQSSSPAEVSREDRVSAADIAPVNMTCGETALRFEDGEWSVASENAFAAKAPKVKDHGPELARVKGENDALRSENKSLQGEVNMMKFKIELLIDMVTLANLDCDKLADRVTD